MTTTATRPVDSIRDALNGRAPELSNDLLARVAWATITEPGDTVAGHFVTEHGAEGALQLLLTPGSSDVDDDVADLAARATPHYSPAMIAQAIARTVRLGAVILTPEHPAWPARVDDLGDAAPFALWTLGDAAALTGDLVAVTGARAATGYGEHIARDLAAELVGGGRSTINGGAYGIDGASLRATLAAGGRPVSVIAGGLDRLYPAGHTDLLQRVATVGVLVSEVPLGTAPTRHRFQQRCRLIAALAGAVVIVEAGNRSGSLIVAAHANALGRSAYAVPGPITSAASDGCHRLIRSGEATILTSHADIIPGL
jgi:DNA processing protein